MIGYFKVTSFTGTKDAGNADTQANVESCMDNNIKGVLYLPPYLRKTQCNIDIDSIIFGILDDITGIGFACFGQDSADFQYFFDANIDIKKSLTVTDDIYTSSDVLASTGLLGEKISLKDHIHNISIISSGDCTSIHASSESGQPAQVNIDTNKSKVGGVL